MSSAAHRSAQGAAHRPAGRVAYEADFHAWCAEQVALVRAGRWSDVDAGHIAEEVEDMGRREKRELRSRLAVLLMHMLKHAYQANHCSGSWLATIRLQRAEIASVLDDSPSLRATLEEALDAAYPVARAAAADESGLFVETFPAESPWSIEEILRVDFLPVA